MNLFRPVIFALSVALMFSAGSSASTATTNYSHPRFTVVEDSVLNLREAGSKIVMDTIEDAIRQGGVALLGDGFQIDSSLGWVFGEDIKSIEGGIDAAIPLLNKNGHIVFTQPGLVFWEGLAEEERIDANLGIVYRTNLANTPVGIDAIGGASLFYDYDFHRVGHERLGIGADIQTSNFHGAFNYYHPLSNEEDGREGYIEEALKGVDFRVALERSVVRAGARVGLWRYDGGEDVADEWRTSVGVDAGLRIFPGVFIEGDWEKHQEDLIIDQRFKLGLAFRFSLPDFKGRSYAGGAMSTDLYKIVDREKRILYEERESAPPVRLTSTDENGMELTSLPEEGDTVTIVGELEALPDPVTLEIVIDETASLAELGVDFNYGHRVYELNADTGQQSAPGAVTDCPDTTCEIMLPAGVTRFDVEVDILSDTDDKEVPEQIVLRVNVPEGYQRMIRGSETTVTIQAHGNEIAFAAASATTLAENNEMDGVQVSVSMDEPSPTPFTLNIATSGTATVGEDYRISGTSLAIPANASSASLTLWGMDNLEGEGSKSIVLTLSGDLPTGWSITDSEHEVTLLDNDLAIFFTSATPGSVDEPASDQSVTVTVGITQAPTADIKVNVAAGGSGETAGAADFTFAATELTFPMNGTASQTATLTVLDDTMPEEDEFIVLTLTDDSNGSRVAEGSGFSLGVNHRITIPANDNIISFSTPASPIAEAGGSATVTATIDRPIPAGETATITLTPSSGSGDENAILGTDYRLRVSSSNGTIRGNTWTLPTGVGSAELTIETIDTPSIITDRSFTLGFAGATVPDGWVVGGNTISMTITDDDRPIPTVSMSADSTSVTEGSTATITLTLSETLGSDAMFHLVTSGDAGYGLTSGDWVFTNISCVSDGSRNACPVTIQQGSTTATANIMFLTDTVTERMETATVTLEIDSGITGIVQAGSPSVLNFNIQATQHTVSFSSATGTAVERGSNASAEIRISPAPIEAVNIPLTITGKDDVYRFRINVEAGGAVIPYQNGMFVYPANATSVVVNMIAENDGNNTEDETVRVSLGTLPVNYTADTINTWTVTINFPRTVNLVYEGEHSLKASTSSANAEIVDLKLQLSKTHNQAITVHLTKGGTADASNGSYRILNQDDTICGADNEPCMVTFPAGQKEASVKFWPRRFLSGEETAIINIEIPAGSQSSVKLGVHNEIQFTLTSTNPGAALPTVTLSSTGNQLLKASTSRAIAEIVNLTVRLNNTSTAAITVHLTKGGTADASNGSYRILNQDDTICGADNEPCMVTFTPGQQEVVVKFWPRRFFSGEETAVIDLEVPEDNRDKVALGLNNRLEFTLR